MEVDKSILTGQTFKLVFCGNEVIPGFCLKSLDHSLCEANVCVESSANCGTTLSNLINVFE